MHQMDLPLQPLHIFVGRQECSVSTWSANVKRRVLSSRDCSNTKRHNRDWYVLGIRFPVQHLFCWSKRESLSVLLCRRNSEKAMREVKEMEDRGLACLRLHAAKYVEALLPPSEPGSSQPCVPSAVRDFCEEAVKEPLQQEQMGLLSDPTAVRYCSALCR